MKLHVKKGDNVKVLSGDDKGKFGVILKVYPARMKAVVEGINLVKKHKKSKDGNKKGVITEEEAPINICKLMVYDPKLNLCSRVGRKVSENGKLKRYFKKSGEFI